MRLHKFPKFFENGKTFLPGFSLQHVASHIPTELPITCWNISKFSTNSISYEQKHGGKKLDLVEDDATADIIDC